MHAEVLFVSTTAVIITVICTALVSAGGVFGILKAIEGARRRGAESEADQIVSKARADAETVRRQAEVEAKEAALKVHSNAERELNRVQNELRERERKLDQREDQLRHQTEDLNKQSRGLENTQRRLTQQLEAANKRATELDRMRQKQQEQLQQIGGLSKEEAKTQLLKTLETELEQEIGTAVMKYERKVGELCEAKGRDMLLVAMQRYAAAHTAETTTSTVDIPSDEMKGRIIGREGRNIRAFEKATGWM